MTTTFKYGTSTTHCYMMGLKKVQIVFFRFERFCITQKNKAKGGFDFWHLLILTFSNLKNYSGMLLLSSGKDWKC